MERLAELLTLGAVLPFLALLADPGKASSYRNLQGLFSKLGWTQPDQILLPATMLFAATAISAGAVRLFVFWANQRFVFQLYYDLSIEVYRRTLYQPYSYHVGKNTSELISANRKVQHVIMSMILPLMEALIGLIVSAFIVGALVTLDARVALLAAVGFSAVYVAVSYGTRRRYWNNGKIVAESFTASVQTVQEGLGGIRDVIIDQTQELYLAKFGRIICKLRDAQGQNAFLAAAPRYVIEAFGMVLIAVLALVLSWRAGGLMVALPVLGALALGAQRLLPMLQLIYNGWSQISASRHSLVDVLDIVDLPADLEPAAENAIPFSFDCDIVLDGVSFHYARGQPVLHNVRLRIEKGTRVGFMGKTGSGKSTLLDLIMGLLQPTAGEIRIDGKPLNIRTVKGWQTQVAHVPQSIYLADTTIAENIAFSVAPDRVDMRLVEEAARKANLHEFIVSLPGSYHAMVGERGVRLSGGQRQRLGIARALYKQAKVLVFDEATSALDTGTEAAVMQAIQSLGSDLTILIIAHRLSTLEMCDRVVRLEDGRIRAVGPPRLLIDSGQKKPTAVIQSPRSLSN